MKNLIKVAFLSSVITAAMVYVILEWKPLRSEESRATGGQLGILTSQLCQRLPRPQV